MCIRDSIIGVDLLEYGKVIIDYMRRRFYFFPFEEGKTDMGGAPALWNVSILPRNDRFEKMCIRDRVYTLKQNDPSYTMPIPDAVLIKNKKLEQNPLAPKREN